MILKIIGAVIGGATGGFFGAILGWIGGGILSNVLLKLGIEGLAQMGNLSAEQKQLRERLFIETLFSLMGHLAKSDAQVSQAEINHVEAFMAEMSMTGEHRKQAIRYFQAGVKADFDADATLDRFLQVAGNALQMKHLLLVYLAGVTFADGQLHAAERALLNKIAGRLGYSQRALEQLLLMMQGQDRFREQGWQGRAGEQAGQERSDNARQRPTGDSRLSLNDAYQALGVSANDSDAAIKRAYRKLMSQYHPDKLIAKGVPEDMIKAATDRAKEISAAYERIKQARGIA